MSTPAQLRIAARIHYHLKHLLDEGIDVAAMLSDAQQAQEVLWVCHASGDAELGLLAREYESITQAAQKAQRAAARAAARNTAQPPVQAKPPLLNPAVALHSAPQDAEWASNTSGFGPTGFDSTGFGLSSIMPPPDGAAPLAKRSSRAKRWFEAMPLLSRRDTKDTH